VNSHFGQHASRLDLDGGTCETGETCRTNDCLNLAGWIGEVSAMLNSANCSNPSRVMKLPISRLSLSTQR